MDTPITPRSRDWGIFWSSVFFVLGFSVVFSLVGVLLQTVLIHSSYVVQVWLGRIGGILIILFGLFVLGLFTPAFLQRDHVVAVRWRFRSRHITSFVFGAAFAVGWTPCVSAALGAILVLAATNATGALLLLFSYTLGIGVPFLVVGLFTNQANALIKSAGPWVRYVEYLFGVLLIVIGILIFVGELSRVANFPALTNVLLSLRVGTSAGGSITSLSIANVAVAIFAGLASFLSPCVLPIIPGFLSYLAHTSIHQRAS